MKSFSYLLNKDELNLSTIKNGFEKSVVHAHVRKTKSGKLSNVKQYEDSRNKKPVIVGDIVKYKHGGIKIGNVVKIEEGKIFLDTGVILHSSDQISYNSKIQQHHDFINISNGQKNKNLKNDKEEINFQKVKRGNLLKDSNNSKFLVLSKDEKRGLHVIDLTELSERKGLRPLSYEISDNYKLWINEDEFGKNIKSVFNEKKSKDLDYQEKLLENN